MMTKGGCGVRRVKNAIKPKGQGRGITVSDFIDGHNGFLALTDVKFACGKVMYYTLKERG